MSLKRWSPRISVFTGGALAMRSIRVQRSKSDQSQSPLYIVHLAGMQGSSEKSSKQVSMRTSLRGKNDC